MQREIVMDTETTGLNARGGDRLVEIGCVEILNRIPSGNDLHLYINPERDVPDEVVAIHGLTAQFLSDKPVFKDVAGQFLDFVGDDPLVIHNATFDIGFLNAELERIRKPMLRMDRVVDTLILARRKHPAGPNNLDALCKRYKIDNSKRIKHGALLDSMLLAEVYLELLGERQAMLGLAGETQAERSARRIGAPSRQRPAPLPPRLSEDDMARHRAFIETLGEKALWQQYYAEQ